MKKTLSILILLCFLFTSIVGPNPVFAQDIRLPEPGVMVPLSPEFNPPILKGIKVHPDNPLRFEFILDRGDSKLSNDALKDESSKLIKYFLASLTIPEKDLWVNLSPYEKDRIIPQSFGLTEMGRDLLAEDYMLKQITASLIYPEGEIGKKFWKRVYEEAVKQFGTTNIPVNTFNKVWIIPEKAVVYENAKAGTAYVVESKLKVMLEQDYLSLLKHEGFQPRTTQARNTNQLGSQIVREIVIPQLTKEVNEDKNFSQLRQAYNSLILAIWYKKKIKDSILSQVYNDRKKIIGVNINDPREKDRIYQRYLQAFKKGAYNYIKEDMDLLTNQSIPRKYFSGGEVMNVDAAMSFTPRMPQAVSDKVEVVLTVDMAPKDRAQLSWNDEDIEGSLKKVFQTDSSEKNIKLNGKIGVIASTMGKATPVRYAVMKTIIDDFVNRYGFDMTSLDNTTKGQLLTIVNKISGQSGHEVWKRFIQEISNQFGFDIIDLEDGEKQKILTAALYVSLGKKINQNGRDISEKEAIFNDTITFIRETFGISDEELKEKKANGGLELGEKIRLITAAYNVALGNKGLETFKGTIQEIQDRFGISDEELKEKKANGGLELGEKIRLITAAYHVALGNKGLETFKGTIQEIQDRFGISDEELKEKKANGGLELGEKIRLITAAYNVALGNKGLETFKGTIQEIQDRFGISDEELKEKKANGGLELGEKIRLITAAYNVALGNKGLETFKGTIQEIQDRFGISDEELKEKKANGGLELGEKIRLITAAYHVALGNKGLETFKGTIQEIQDRFGISDEELKEKKANGGLELGEKIRLITAAYHVALGNKGLETFKGTIQEIQDRFGISDEELKEKKANGGLELGEKIRLITAAYNVALGNKGLETFKGTIQEIQDRFGISDEELKEKKANGGLELGEKIRLITAAYHVALGNKGLETFKGTIQEIQDRFGISDEELKEKKANGGLELGEKIRLITAAYHVALGNKGLETFKGTIQEIQDRFGISDEELKEKKANGGLELGEKIRLITAAYNVALGNKGLETFKGTIQEIQDRFGISDEELKEKKANGGLELGEKIRLITAAYNVALGNKGLETFKGTIQEIQDRFGISDEELKEKKANGGLELGEKIRLITAAYNVALGNKGLETFRIISAEYQDLVSLPSNKKIDIIVEISVRINPFGVMNNDNDWAMISDFLPGIDFASIAEVISFNDYFISPENVAGDMGNGRNSTLVRPRNNLGMDFNSKNTGGIDFTVGRTPLEIRNPGKSIKFRINPAMLAKLQAAPGFVPIIIDYEPLISLKEFLVTI